VLVSMVLVSRCYKEPRSNCMHCNPEYCESVASLGELEVLWQEGDPSMYNTLDVWLGLFSVSSEVVIW